MDAEQDLREHQRQYLDFLDDSEDQGLYNEKVRDMIRSHSNRLLVNINDLRRKNWRRAMRLLNEANIELLAFQRALKEYVLTVDDAYGKQFEEFHVGFEGSFGSKHVTPRSLSADLLGCLVCVEGIITKSSQVRPKVVKCVHYCPATGKTMERKYTDLTYLEPFPTSALYPTKDEDGNSLETEYGLSVYRDHQTLSIQETPERAPAGQLPRVLDVILDGDLVDSCKPCDRVHVVGTYRCLPGKKGGYTSGTFRTVLLACSVIQQNKEAAPLFSRRDVAKIKKFSKNNRFDPFEMLAHSLAPSIHGHTHIKKAVLAMLLGGVEKILENGTRLRGDINILLVGDPSTAKSQMLRYVLHSAPRAVTTTGRGTSGVGLTAAVTTDMETGDRQLEAGAMVLADRGVVCIDEFDKMSDLDRTAIHEVMEQGRVTIAKAGIHAKLNARCSVLAAANPVYGRYDDYKAPMDNIGMQDSLLSRFDLIFVVLDEMDPEQDRRISEHVLRMHRYRNPGEQDGEVLLMGGGGECLATGDGGKGGVDDEEEEEEEEEVMVFDKHDALLHGDSRAEKFVSSKFLKKYIHVARALKPVLTREACDLISTEYAKLRAQETANRDTAKTQPVTARTLETLIRLSTAHAKARMSKHVEEQDAESAINLVNFAYFKKVAVKPRKKKKDKERKRQRPAGLPHPPKKRPGEDGYDPYDFSSSESEGEESAPPTSQSQDQEVPMDTGPVQLSAKRLTMFRSKVGVAFSGEHAQSLPLARLEALVNAGCHDDPFSSGEVSAGLVAMEEANQVMVSEGVVFLI